MGTSKNTAVWAIAVVGVVIIAVVLITWVNGATSTKIAWSFPTGNLTLDIEEDLQDHETMLKKLFENQFSRPAIIEWLRRTQKLFLIDDPALLLEIKSLCPDVSNEDPLTRQQRIKNCISQSVVLGRLRELAEGRVAPFQYEGEIVRVGFPDKPNPQLIPGRANVCRGGGYEGKRLQLTDVQRKVSIEVVANAGTYLCTGYDNQPQVQLHLNDSNTLFGTSSGGVRKAIAVIL